MQLHCCVPYCKSTLENDVSASLGNKKSMTFHGFPNEDKLLRTAWLQALGLYDSDVPNSAVVCSLHFLNDDFQETESGLSQLCSAAIPSTVQVCMVCLGTDSKLFLMSKYKLEAVYRKLTGCPESNLANLRPALCVHCAQRLKNFNQFRDKSLAAHLMMMELIANYEFITLQHMKEISNFKNQLQYNLVCTNLGPNHCNLYIEHSEDDKLTEKVFVKNEEHYDSMLDDDDLGILSEDSNQDRIDSEFNESNMKPHDGIKVAKQQSDISQDPLKCESTFECTQCFRDMPLHEYNIHMTTHLQDADGPSNCEYDAAQACESNARAGSTRALSHSARNKQGVRKRKNAEPHPFNPCTYTLVVPLSARRVTKRKNKKHATEDTYTVQQIKRGIDIQIDESDHRSSEKRVVKSRDNLKKNKKSRQAKTFDRLSIDSAGKDSNFQEASQVLAIEYQRDTSNTLETFTECSKEDIKLVDSTKKTSYTKKKRYTCDVCPHTFKRRNIFLKHIESHMDMKHFTCEFCEYKTKCKSNLARHTRTHTGEKPFPCKLCDSNFSDKGNLMKHMKTHTGEKPYSCQLCDYKCLRNGTLVLHMRTHTGEKPYSCKLCDYKCAHNGDLGRHMRVHTGEKPFTCKICGYKCSDKQNLVIHRRTHTGEKPYSCTMCEYKSARNSDLARHMKYHTGEKPYSCHFCQYTCVQNGDLRRHMKVHTVENRVENA